MRISGIHSDGAAGGLLAGNAREAEGNSGAGGGIQLLEDADCWGSDCRFGVDEASAEIIHVSEIKKISWAESEGLESFYLEALVKSCRRTKMPLQE